MDGPELSGLHAWTDLSCPDCTDCMDHQRSIRKIPHGMVCVTFARRMVRSFCTQDAFCTFCTLASRWMTAVLQQLLFAQLPYTFSRVTRAVITSVRGITCHASSRRQSPLHVQYCTHDIDGASMSHCGPLGRCNLQQRRKGNWKVGEPCLPHRKQALAEEFWGVACGL